MTEAIFQPYRDLLEDLNSLGSKLEQIHAPHLNCRAGCADCCQQHLSVFAVEAAHLQAAVKGLNTQIQSQIRAQAQEVREQSRQACPLLLKDRCSIYRQRPVICRSHGHPMHYAGENPGEVYLDVCPLNFTSEGALEAVELAETLPLDRLNLRLAAINQVYCRDILQDPARAGKRMPLAEVVLTSILSPQASA